MSQHPVFFRYALQPADTYGIGVDEAVVSPGDVTATARQWVDGLVPRGTTAIAVESHAGIEDAVDGITSLREHHAPEICGW